MFNDRTSKMTLKTEHQKQCCVLNTIALECECVIFYPLRNHEELMKCVKKLKHCQEFIYCTHKDLMQGDGSSDACTKL